MQNPKEKEYLILLKRIVKHSAAIKAMAYNRSYGVNNEIDLIKAMEKIEHETINS